MDQIIVVVLTAIISAVVLHEAIAVSIPTRSMPIYASTAQANAMRVSFPVLAGQKTTTGR